MAWLAESSRFGPCFFFCICSLFFKELFKSLIVLFCFIMRLLHHCDSEFTFHVRRILLRPRPGDVVYVSKVTCGLVVVAVVDVLFYVHGKHLRSCRDGQLT